MEIDYQDLFEKSPGLFLVLDIHLKIVGVTDAYLAATLTKRESILYKDIFNVFPDNPADKTADGVHNLRSSLQKVLQLKAPDRMPIQKYDIRRSENEFEERYWSPYNVPLLDESGNVNYIIHTVEDITSLLKAKRLEAIQKDENISLSNLNKSMSIEIYERIRQLDKANLELKDVNEALKEKTRLLELSNEDHALFAETAAHDIKAPFRSIGGHMQIIMDKTRDELIDEEVKASFESIRAARKRISILLDDLLEFASVARSSESRVEIDINKLLQEVLANLEFNIREKKAKVNYELNFPGIKGTYIQISQLFQNLIGNALKFCENVPVIDISFTKVDNTVEFSIKDNGIGIEKENYERVFAPFERLPASQSIPGTGLGLAICKRIVDRHNGHIRISSGQQGTTFYFTLPQN
jgi:signal transduction histidine kinase